MNKEQKSKLDRIYRKDKIKKYALVMFGISIFLSFCSMYIFSAIPRAIEKEEIVNGIVIRAAGTPSSTSLARTLMIIKLTNNQQIRVPMKEGLTFKNGAKVELTKTTFSKGGTKYTFLKYVQ